MELYGWGRYPRSEGEFHQARDRNELVALLQRLGGPVIASGAGRSYGDSALASHLINTQYLDNFLRFDKETGVLRCGAGTTLQSIIELCAPQGWFPPVLPGTCFVTVGGATAADIHGKNHHRHGSYCDHLLEITLLLADGSVETCSTAANSELFHATCGGMGLTGIICDLTLQLTRVPGLSIRQRTLPAANLAECMDLLEANESATYSVAWLDCLARGEHSGRSIIYLGEHADDGDFTLKRRLSLSVPFNAPSFMLNRYSVAAFNSLLYSLRKRGSDNSSVDFDKYFFPLDNIRHWNRLYGRRGFLQYQFAIPQESAREGVDRVLRRIAKAGKGSFLSVLKQFGAGNQNLLSFPMAGYTLALDFKFENDLLPLLDELDRMVLDHGGRLYLAKDARMSEASFKSGYPNWEQFMEIKAKYDPNTVFASLQSRRLGLTP